MEGQVMVKPSVY